MVNKSEMVPKKEVVKNHDSRLDTLNAWRRMELGSGGGWNRMEAKPGEEARELPPLVE